MGGAAGAGLATSVTKAGGLGFIGVGYAHAEWLEQQCDLAEEGQYGVGFITWKLAEEPKLLDIALKHQPRAIMLSFGDIAPFVEKIKSYDIPLICQVQTVEQALDCLQKGADIIVAQGTEAGGHGADRGTISLVPAVVDAVSPLPVFAAGGICDVRGVSAVLALGAQGVLIGSRFLASEESLVSNIVKQKILNAKACDTIRTRVFDYARNLTWPEPYTARVLKNKFTDQWHEVDDAKDKIGEFEQQQYVDASINEDYDIGGVFVGEAVELINEILPANVIVEKLSAAFEEDKRSN